MTKKIIWIDDDSKLMNKSEQIFTDYGFETIKCETIAKGLKEIILGTSNNLLLDIDFPRSPKEGLIFLQQLRSINPNLKVVLFTGYPELDEAVEAIKNLMAADYISKPIPVDKQRRSAFFDKLHEAFKESEKAIKEVSVLRNTNLNKVQKIHTCLESCDIESLIAILQSIFAGLSYNMKTLEGYYHGFIQIILDLAGIKILSEVETNIGRIDAVVETEKYLYLMEFKLTDAVTATRQIIERKYFQRYLTTSKQIVLIGMSFDTIEKNIKDYRTEMIIR